MEGEVAEAAEENIRETCKELDIDVIDLAVSVGHVHLFIKSSFIKSIYGKMLRSPPKYSVSGIAKRIKGRSSKLSRDQFPQLKEWCPGQFYADFPKGNQILRSKIGQYRASSCYHESVGHGWEW